MGKKKDLNQKQKPSISHRKIHNNKIGKSNTNLQQTENSKKDSNNKNETAIPQSKQDTEELKNDDLKNKISKTIKLKLTIKIITNIIIVAFPIIGLVLLATYITLTVPILSDNSEDDEMAIGSYYASQCPEITVKLTQHAVDRSSNYDVVSTETYPLEDYVTGVVWGEAGPYFNNIDMYKEYAISARTFVLKNAPDCVIESSDRKQVFKDPTGESSSALNMIKEAVKDTEGQVLIKDGELYDSMYDAFCTIAVDNNYYTLKQKNQKIPRRWADSQSGISSDWKDGTCKGNHGYGISQYGAYYLVTEQGKNYLDIFDYYLGDDVAISSSSFMSSVANLEIKDSTNSNELHEQLSRFLSSHGSSMEQIDSYIKSNVEENGYGTREGVVTAAVSLVNFLYDNFRVRIPYYWGGQYQFVGVNPNFGAQTTPAVSTSGKAYNFTGMDCSGFVSWAIRNGGYNIGRQTTWGFHSMFSGNSCSILDSSCIGQPGDLINSETCHVQMIVAVDEASNSYFVAESTGSLGIITRKWGMHTDNCGGSSTRILKMDNFYNNKGNVAN